MEYTTLTPLTQRILDALESDWTGDADNLCGYDEYTDTYCGEIDTDGLREYIKALPERSWFFDYHTENVTPQAFHDATEQAIQYLVWCHEEDWNNAND